jgi:RNA polymerase sigma factor (sigma-70 family)
MANRPLPSVWRYIRCLAGTSPCDSQSDCQLLQQFVANRDEAAFVALLKRHGPLVLGVCQQVLGDLHAAEDVFQATFLVLARKAASIRRSESLGPWLYRVAINLAKTAKINAAQRQAHERRAAVMSQASPADPTLWHDWQPLLHDEINRLPEKYRVAVVLCYLEGQTNEEAARRLGWPAGTVKGRLSRARELLRSRLVRRGLTLSAAGFAAALSPKGVCAGVPGPLLTATLTAALPYAVGHAVPAGSASALALALAEGGLKTMAVAKWTFALAALVVFLGIGGGASLIALRAGNGAQTQTPGRSNSTLVSRNNVDKPVAQQSRGQKAKAALPAKDRKGGLAAVARKDGARDDFGPEVKGLRAKVTLGKRQFEVGEPIPATYVVKNVSKNEQTLWHSGFWPNHLVLIHDAQGKEPSLTREGKQRRDAFAPGGKRGKNAPWNLKPGSEDTTEPELFDLDPQRLRWNLKPGSEDTTEGNYDLATLYDLSRAGRYSVQYIYEEKQGGWEARLPSNKAAFRIIAKKKANRMAESLAVRVNGADFQALVQKKMTAPAPGGALAVDLGLRITNRGKKALLFSVQDTFRVVLRSALGQVVQGKLFGSDGARRPNPPVRVEPGKAETIAPPTSLLWSKESNSLLLCTTGSDGNEWRFAGLQPGKYVVSFEYANAKRQDGERPLWVGKGTTREGAFEIVSPEKKATISDKAKFKSVSVNQVDFQAVLETQWSVPAPGGQQVVDLGLQMTNRSTRTLLVNSYHTLRPGLKSADGKLFPVMNGVTFRSGFPLPLLLAPGKTTTIRPRAHLDWLKDGKSLRLIAYENSGRVWYFEGLQPGKYFFDFGYENTEALQAKNNSFASVQLKEGQSFWFGKVTTKAAAFAIVSPKEQAKGSAKALTQAKALELAHKVAEKALDQDYANLRKRYQQRGLNLPAHQGAWIPFPPESYHKREITKHGKRGWLIRWWTAKEGGLGYEAVAEVDGAGKVRLVKAVVIYAQE